MRRIVLGSVTVLALAFAPSAVFGERVATFVDAKGGGVAPDAAKVMVRGQQDLSRAIRVALEPRRKSVLFVVDVTPYTAHAEPEIARALFALDQHADGVLRWRMTRLGKTPGTAVNTPSKLTPRLASVLAKDTKVIATLPALRKSIAKLRDSKATIIYFADWHFEDTAGLEDLNRLLRQKGHALHVIGSEACFGRGWSDGFYPPNFNERMPDGTSRLYADHISRSPFGPEDDDRPWHGGDTAWPHIPFRYRGTHWATKFHARLPAPPKRKTTKKPRYGKQGKKSDKKGESGEHEDLQDRRHEKQREDALHNYFFPLASSFGSWSLMRAAGLTGGRYILWSWNKSGRTEIRYDYSRCNMFAPDLRSRRDIRSDIPRSDVARALLDAWHRIANHKVRIATYSAPVEKNYRTAREMELVRGDNEMPFSFHDEKDYKQFLKSAERALPALDAAITRLKPFAESVGDDDRERRYYADAALLHHILSVKRFQLGEAYAAAVGLPKDAWKNKDLTPLLDSVWYLDPAKDAKDVHPRNVPLYDKARGKKITEARKTHLRKYIGTPFGELVRKNGVFTYRLDWRPRGSPGRPDREAPSQSKGPKVQTPPSAPGSTPSGPSTGGG